MNFPWLSVAASLTPTLLLFVYRGMGEQEENGNQEYQADRNACEKTGGVGKWKGRRGFRTNGHYKYHGGYRNSRTSSNRGW